jgi:putative transposase
MIPCSASSPAAQRVRVRRSIPACEGTEDKTPVLAAYSLPSPGRPLPALYRLNEYQENHDELPAMTTLRVELPDLKEWWDVLSDVYSKVLQIVVERLFDNLQGLSAQRARVHGWCASMEAATGVPQFHLQSIRSPESSILVGSQNPLNSVDGFKLDKKGGQTVLSLSKLADIPIRLPRNIPDDAALKQVTLKKESTGEWFATFAIEVDREPPTKPENPENVVGIDVGILKYTHDTDGTAVGSLDLSDERERLEREQQSLARKQHGSNNYEKQRHRVAKCHAVLKRKTP